MLGKTSQFHHMYVQITYKMYPQRYASDNCRTYHTAPSEMKKFLAVNLIMGLNKLPTVAHYWSSDPIFGMYFRHSIVDSDQSSLDDYH